MKMLRRISSLILTVAMLAVAAFADQAAYISKEDAVKASAFLKGKPKVTRYCAPCGTPPGEIILVRTVEAAPSKGDLWEVKVNEEGVDLAYLYYQTDNGKWKNVALELGLNVKDVPVYMPDKGAD